MAHAGNHIDVCVVTWNTRDLTVSALRRLLAAADGLDLRLLIRDNGSTDGTAAALRQALPAASVDEGAQNLGFAGGVNTLLRRSDAAWVLLLNSDAWPETGAIRELLDCAVRHPDAAIVVPKLLSPDGGVEPSVWPLPSLGVAVRSAWRPRRFIAAADREQSVGWAIGAAWLMRREAIADVGELDESLHMYAEDLEWCWRACDRGWKVWVAPGAVVRHVGNASGALRFGETRTRIWVANSIQVYRRRHGLVATVVWRVASACGSLLAAGRARRIGDRDRQRFWLAQARLWVSVSTGRNEAGSP